jgi:hypothetical protein
MLEKISAVVLLVIFLGLVWAGISGAIERRRYLRNLAEALLYAERVPWPGDFGPEWRMVDEAHPFDRLEAWRLLRKEGKA